MAKTTTPGKVEFAYIFSDMDANKFHHDLKAFKKGKKIIECIISCTPLITGVNEQNLAQITLVPSAYIVFEATQGEIDTFIFNLKMSGKYI